MDETPERQILIESESPRRFRGPGAAARFVVASILLGSTVAFGACHAAVSTEPSLPGQSTVPSATTTDSQDDLIHTVTPTVTPIDTGTGETFTINWPVPNGTSLPYLTFYNDVKYTNRHLWVRLESPDTVRIGFTEYGALMFGAIWSVNITSAGSTIGRDTTFGFVQGEDTMDYSLTSPVSGTVLEVNKDVLGDYSLINRYPFTDGWLVVIRISNPDDLKLLLTAAQYARQCCPPCHCNN